MRHPVREQRTTEGNPLERQDEIGSAGGSRLNAVALVPPFIVPL